jgi:hypothetical protein
VDKLLIDEEPEALRQPPVADPSLDPPIIMAPNSTRDAETIALLKPRTDQPPICTPRHEHNFSGELKSRLCEGCGRGFS